MDTRSPGGRPARRLARRESWLLRRQQERELEAKKIARANEETAALSRLWPKCFFVPEGQRRPLKVGIGDELREIMAPAIKAGRITTDDINIALRRYVGSDGYLEHCSILNNPRINLDGREVGCISYKQALYSRDLLSVGRSQ
jgi:sRNA-binding protein